MSDVNVAPRALPPRVNALQSAWLREIGLPRALTPGVSTRGPAKVDAAAPPDTRARRSAQPASALAARAGVAPPPAAETATANTVPSRPTASEATATTAATIAAAAEKSTRPGKPAARPAASKPVAAPIAGERNTAHDLVALQGATVEGLRDLVADCGVCKLCHTRAHAVFGAGHANAEWMIVGEAPGEQEDAQALPFVGKSGQLLTQMLEAVGVDRERDVFITNIVKCRPPGNRNPKAEEIEACKPFLLRQIDLVAPKRLLVLGRFAAQVLLGSDANLGALRGQLHSFTDASGRRIPLVVSFHPAYLLRSPLEKARTWQDLHLALSARRTDD